MQNNRTGFHILVFLHGINLLRPKIELRIPFPNCHTVVLVQGMRN